MSAAQSSNEQRQLAAEIDSVGTTTHAETNWMRRGPGFQVDLEEAWSEATPVHYPGAYNGAVARLHEETDMLLLVIDQSLVTCFPVAGCPREERNYIKSQVTSE